MSKKQKKEKIIKPEMTKQEKDEAIAKEIMEWFISIVVAVAVVLVIFNFVGHMVRVDGHSMNPTLVDNERVWCSKLAYDGIEDVSRGDIVITKYPNSPYKYVKRVIGLPGDTIEINNTHLYINDTLIEEDYIAEAIISNFEKVTIPDGCVFVMGDNRNNSRDSRASSVGILNYEEMIVGKVSCITWPISKWEMVEHETYEELE